MRARTGTTRAQRRRVHPPAPPTIKAWIPKDMPVDHLLPPDRGTVKGGALGMGVFRVKKHG